jgi:MoxR-like ATPase
MLYGQKASGKTSLIHSLLKETDTKYIEINCTLANKRSNFLKLFRVELHKYLKAKEAINEHDGSVPVNLDTWINDLKRITYGNSRAAE